MGKFTHIASRDGGGRGGEETDVTVHCFAVLIGHTYCTR